MSTAVPASNPGAALRVGGMLIGYYVLCPRKAWLSMRGLWMEQESDQVAIGRLLGETSYARERKELDLTATAPDGTELVARIDWADLREGVLHETKKGRSTEDAHRWQLKFYLWLLALSGVTRGDGRPYTGMLNYPALKRTEAVELTAEDEQRLKEMAMALRRLASEPRPPPRITRRKFCRACAFEELCYG